MFTRTPAKRMATIAATAAVLAGICLLGTARADDSAEKGKLIAIENVWNQAQLNHDVAALNALVPDTFIYTDWDGTIMNKAQFLADIKDPSTTMTLVANKDVQVFLYKHVAIIAGIYHAKGKSKGKGFDHWGRFTDTWIFEKDRWICVASHTNLMKKPGA